MTDNADMLPPLPGFPRFSGVSETLASLPSALSRDWTWIAVGAVLAVLVLWALRRTKRMVIAAAVAVTGLLAAWNAGLLPLMS